ncbi:hypothetical protein Taro_038623 [Colocasia esculenta]|uniref:Uncharacterized protein n=1 Tax=Colocasia esculenta TaxID=4460 RepID=A0A843WEE2_COLES|nr:hypothetical protein [Colocasia esculenta]
MAVATPSIT